MDQASGAMALPHMVDPAHLHDFLDDSIGCMVRLRKIYGPTAGFRKGQGVALFAFGPDYNRLILANADKFFLSSGVPGPRKSAQRRFASGLLGLNGEQHATQRRLLMPPFRKEAVESYRDLIVGLTEEWLADWRAGPVFDLEASIKDFSLLMTTRLLFGIDDLEQAHAIEAAFEPWMDLNHQLFFMAAMPLEMSGGDHYTQLLTSADRLEAELIRLVEHPGRDGAGGKDILSILLRARDAGLLAQGDVVGHTHTMFNAAYHTSSSALTWTLFLVAQHPRVMAELLAELRGTLGGTAPTVANIGRLTLLDRVIKESMRLLPPVVYLSPRVNLAPTSFGPYKLPPGTMVVGSQYMTHHMAELYPDPERFLPDRWIGAVPSPYAYLPFGAGPRMCLGAPLALLQMKIALSMLLQRYRLTVVPGARIDRHATLMLGPRQGIPVVASIQDGLFTASPVQGNIHESVVLPETVETVRRAA